MSTRRGRKRAAEAINYAMLTNTPNAEKTNEEPNALETITIKVEESDEENREDVKPDVDDLQLQMTLSQQQQHVLGHQQPLALATAMSSIPTTTLLPTMPLPTTPLPTTTTTTTITTPTLLPTTALPPAVKRVVYISDWFRAATAVAAVRSGVLSNKVEPVSARVGRKTKLTPGECAAAATAAAQSTSAAQATKVLDDTFEKDEFDLQESDSDEEFYSDIDFDEDDELIEDDDDIDLYDPKWTDQLTAPRSIFQFNMNSLRDVGLSGRPKSLSPLFYFERLLGDKEKFFSLLAQGCNERAQQMYNDNKVGQTYMKEISSEEAQIFFGLCLQMSTIKLATLAEYWNDQLCYGFKGFGEKMSLNRFQMLLRVLNFERLTEEPARKDPDQAPFGLLRPLLDFFNQRMGKIYKFGQRLVLNQPIVFWKGKCDWLNNLKEKFRCNAITLHFLTENTGLLLKIVPDVERKDRKQNVRNSKLLVDQRIALAQEILKDQLGLGHTVIVSKHYGSYGLALNLTTQNTYCTGMLDNKRYGNSKQLIQKKLENNEFAIKYATPIMMSKWCRHGKCVYFYSSDCLAIYSKETSRHSNDPRPKLIKELDWQLKLPANIREYMERYQIGVERKEMKWDRQIAIYVLNLMVLNAYILYTMYAQIGRAHIIELHLKDTTKLESFAKFRQNIVASLLQTHDENEDRQHAEKPRTTNPNDSEEDDCETGEGGQQAGGSGSYRKLLDMEHMPMVIPRRKGKVMKKKCRICRKGGLLTFSKLCCEVCPGMPGLCETPCFQMWHAQLRKCLAAGERIKTRTFGTSGEKTIYF